MDPGPAERELLERALRGDADSFGRLCDQHRRRIWRIIASVAHGPDVDDLAQETVIRAYCARRSYRREAPFHAWLCRIAVNVAHDYQRSAWRRRVILGHSSDAESGCPAGEAERRETVREVRKAVARLPEKLRVPIWLHYFEQFSFTEIAALERAPESTIRSRVKAGLKRLERTLTEGRAGERASGRAGETPQTAGEGC